MTKDNALLEKNDGPWYYEMCMLGFNYRITDFQCALGINQLNKLDRFLTDRRRIAKYYDSQFFGGDIFITPIVDEKVRHAYHLYPLQIKFDTLHKTKKEIFELLKERRINCQVHYIPVHLQPYYRKQFGFKNEDFPVAEKFYQNEISIPMYPSLSSDDLEYICKTIREVIR